MPLMHFSYHNNDYERFYLYKRPDATLHKQTDIDNFNTCVGFVSSNDGYPMASEDTTRQVRLHTCFSYCRNGNEAWFQGDDRPNCVDLVPSERTSLICLYPDDTCEGTTAFNSWLNAVSVRLGIAAIFAANALQLVFEVLCLLLMKMKVNSESAKENCNLLAF